MSDGRPASDERPASDGRPVSEDARPVEGAPPATEQTADRSPAGSSIGRTILRAVLIGGAMLAAAIVLTFYTGGRVYQVPASGPERTVLHPTGLAILLPEGAEAEPTANGFELVRAAGGDTPERAKLGWETGTCRAVPPDVDSVGAGPQGIEYAMRTQRPLGDGCLLALATQRRELGQPGFAFALRVFQTARLDPAAREDQAVQPSPPAVRDP